MKITGTTRLYAIVGDPIAQVRSPQVFTERFASEDVDAVMIPIHVRAERFDEVMPALFALGNLDGVLVTVPFKTRMTAFAHRLGASARAVGAVNALRREADGSWSGDMFDGIGFVRGALRKGARLKGRRVSLFGAGGAGSAIASALADAGVATIHVIDVDRARAEALVDRLRTNFSASTFDVADAVSSGVDMIVNASPVGMRPDDPMPGTIGKLAPETLVGDVVIVDPPTALIRHARACGCSYVDGRDMHGGQVEAISGFFAATRAG